MVPSIFSFSYNVFQRVISLGHSRRDCLIKGSPFTKQTQVFKDIIEDSLWKHCGKGENAGYQHFLLFHNVFKSKPAFSHFSKCFLSSQKQFFLSISHFLFFFFFMPAKEAQWLTFLTHKLVITALLPVTGKLSFGFSSCISEAGENSQRLLKFCQYWFEKARKHM